MKKRGEYAEYRSPDGESIVFPVLTVEGDDAGPTLCVTAGIHGCEYPAIASAIALYKRLEPKSLKGTVKVIPVVDMQAFKTKTMFVCPKDKKNVNRVFPGSLEGTYSEVLIHHLFNDFIKGSDYYIDLHSADFGEVMIPFCEIHQSADEKINEIGLEMAKHSGIADIVVKSGHGTVNNMKQSYSTAADAGIPSLVLNAGQIDQDIDHYVNRQLAGLLNILTYLKLLDHGLKTDRDPRLYKAPVHIRSKVEGAFYWKCKVGDEVKEGDTLGVIEDLFGNQIDTVEASAKGKVLLINTTIPVKENSLLVELIVEK